MKETFWLLDLNQQIYNGKSSICLWGINRQGKRVLVIDTHYQPYFYLLPKPKQDIEKIKEQLENAKPHPSIESVRIEKKKLLDHEQQLLRVSTNDPFSIDKVARQTVNKLGLEASLEADLRQATKYQNEYGIRPCKWYTIQIENSLDKGENYSVDLAGTTTSPPTPATIDETPELRLLAFKILVASQAGLPMGARDPIRAIAWTTNKGTSGLFQSDNNSEAKILQQFVEQIRKENPDIILTFEGNTLDWPYLAQRSNKSNVQLNIGRQQGTPHQSLYGHFSVTGRGNIDLIDFARYIYDIKHKTLENLASYFGISTSQGNINETDYFTTWSNPSLRKNLLNQFIQQTSAILSIGTEAIEYVIQVSALSGLPPDQAIAAAVGFRVDSYLMMEAHAKGQVIPSREEQYASTYKGALVIEPQTGLYEDVALLDFSSMYPSLIVKYNISPDTLTKDGQNQDTYEMPEVHHRFKMTPPGFYKIALTKLLEARRATKAQLKTLNPSDRKYRLLRARDTAIKVTTNAVYGYAGWAGARWYSREVAESAAALGRDTIIQSISTAKDLGLKVLYGDTDSLFVNYDKNLVGKFLDTIEEKLGLDISLSQVYKRILFTEAKKKYAGIREDGEIEVVGLEAIRGDWSTIAKDVQNKVIRIVLEQANPSRAVDYVRSITRETKVPETPITSYIIWKKLTKPLGRYEVNAPHVEAAKKMLKDGWPVSVGDKIGFIITKNPGKLYQKAEPHYKVIPDQVDYDYYVQNQIIPAAARILEIFGFNEEELLAEKGGQQELSIGTDRT